MYVQALYLPERVPKKRKHFDVFFPPPPENRTIHIPYVNPVSIRDGLGVEQTKGCACDIAAHWYSLSRALNPNWGARYASQREIRTYWEELWTRYGLCAHTRLGTEVVRATWDAHAQHYTVVLEDVTSKACRTVSAKVVLSATGGFQQPRIPEDLLGLETFLGDKWHSAAWRHDVSLAGKRVGVIGNGCSA